MLSLRAVLMSLILIGFSTPSFAAETVPFDQKSFATAQAEGRPILIDIAASWCPTCAAQEPITKKLTAEPKFRNLIVFQVDFDAQKDAVRSFHAQLQSTLIGFDGTKETARSVGDTDEKSIERLLRSTEG